MDAEYEGNVEATREDVAIEPAECKRHFRALLDDGLVKITTGNRVFGVLSGALDGGVDIHHSEKRFAGFNKDSKQLDPEVHCKYVYGGHVAAYMRTLMEDEPKKYQPYFNPKAKKSEKEPPKQHKRHNLKKLT
ncbi:hypothetical protein REPUB_Repub06bG0099200 [Reevesia pubescens]